MILVVDNYDSFVYNLVHYFQILGKEVVVVRNDDNRLTDLDQNRPEAIILSPGPCTPMEAGYCVELIRTWSGTIPFLGVCLGHQCIGAAFDVPVIRSPQPVHGLPEKIYTKARHPLFQDLTNPFEAARYHSLILPHEAEACHPLVPIAWTVDGLNMAVAHIDHPTYGVQFHPESILTPEGLHLLHNFLTLTHIDHEQRHYT